MDYRTNQDGHAEFLQAVGQATRDRILEVLAEEERCVCNIQVAVGKQQSNVSKCLAVLRRSEILTARRGGGWGGLIYRLRNWRTSEFLGQQSDLMRGDFSW